MDALLAEVKTIGLELSAHLQASDFNLAPYFQTLALVDAKKGRLVDLTSSGQVVLNSGHPQSKRLQDGKPGRAEVLVLAIISLVNRAEKDLTDMHQRLFHQRLLGRLVD